MKIYKSDKFFIWVAGLLLLTIIIFMISEYTNKPNENYQYSMTKNSMRANIKNKLTPLSQPYYAWLWDYSYISNKSKQKLLLKFAEDNNIKTIFLNIGEYVDLKESGKNQQEISTFFATLKKFLLDSKKQNTEVEALFGAPNWSNDSHFYLIEMILNDVVFHDDIKFSGVHIDIEPHGQKNFSKNKNKYYTNYLNAIKYIAQQLDKQRTMGKISHDFKFSIDIPHWYDDQKTKLEYDGKNQPVFYHLIDILEKYYSQSRLVLMSYDIKNNGKKAIDKSTTELEYLSNRNSPIKIIIGQEFTKQPQEKITFFNSDYQSINLNLKNIDNAFKDKNSYKSVALHTISALMKK